MAMGCPPPFNPLFLSSFSASNPNPQSHPFPVAFSLPKTQRVRPLLKVQQTSPTRCSFSSPTNTTTTTEPKPVITSARAFAPATVANLGPAFDSFGVAIDGLGDFVTATVDPRVRPGEIVISKISGSHASPKLSREPFNNCVGLAGIATLKMLNVQSVGLSLSLEKNLPLCSGLGSSAASAVAASVAINAIFEKKLTTNQLAYAALEAETKVSGYHADNVGAALLGGFVLVKGYEPLELKRLNVPEDKELLFVLATPEFGAPTKEMREILPQSIGMAHHVHNCGQALALGVALMEGDVVGFGKALSQDKIFEPHRAPLIPGMEGVKKAAIEAGAYGCTISGAGSTVVAVVEKEERGLIVGQRMVEAFREEGHLRAGAVVKRVDTVGARLVGIVPRRLWL